MSARSRLKANAERKFPVRIRVAVPAEGFGRALDELYAWLDQTYGRGGYAIAGDNQPGQDAIAIYLPDLLHAGAMIERFELELVLFADMRLI